MKEQGGLEQNIISFGAPRRVTWLYENSDTIQYYQKLNILIIIREPDKVNELQLLG